MTAAGPVLPDYGGACIASLAPALLARDRPLPSWLPEAARGAAVVLFVVDGLGWHQLRERARAAPVLTALTGGPITSVAPTTTAVALTSIATGCAPAEHGVVGYRMHVGEGRVLNVLRWATADGDARELAPPRQVQRRVPFCGTAPPVVNRVEFTGTGFTEAYLGGTRWHPWWATSSLVVEVRALVRAGEPFVFAYYDGLDRVAHAHGLGEHYEAEVAFVDRLAGDLLDALPGRAALVVTSDHGQVDVGERCLTVDGPVLEDVALQSGEGRFRWLHARDGATDRLAARAAEAYGGVAWVRTRQQVIREGWLGGRLEPEVAARLGDVALVPYEPVAFVEPGEYAGPRTIRSRHGSLTAAEMLVPLLVGRGSRGAG